MARTTRGDPPGVCARATPALPGRAFTRCARGAAAYAPCAGAHGVHALVRVQPGARA